MKLNAYQDYARTTAQYPGQGLMAGLNYAIAALGGEAGEILNYWKKILRKQSEGVYLRESESYFKGDPTARNVLIDELGDILWYAAALADELNITLEAVASHNLGKLAARAEKNAIKDHA